MNNLILIHLFIYIQLHTVTDIHFVLCACSSYHIPYGLQLPTYVIHKILMFGLRCIQQWYNISTD